MKLLVCLLKADVSLAMNVLSGEIPMTSGEPLQATTSWSGSSLDVIHRPQVPSHRDKAFSVASTTEIFSVSLMCPISFAITSVSVWDVNLWPRPFSSLRSSFALLIVPLWTRAILPLLSTWGWAFSSVFPPWVAHRVCAMPIWCPIEALECFPTSSIPSALSPSLAYFAIIYKQCEKNKIRQVRNRYKYVP